MTIEELYALNEQTVNEYAIRQKIKKNFTASNELILDTVIENEKGKFVIGIGVFVVLVLVLLFVIRSKRGKR
jgi:uncharacterized membrane protein